MNGKPYSAKTVTLGPLYGNTYYYANWNCLLPHFRR